MAYSKHVELVKKGSEAVRAWWKKADEGEILHLDGADLRGQFLRDIDFFRADLRGAQLQGVELSFSHLAGAELTDANLAGAFLFATDFTGADLRGTDLSNTNLVQAIFRETNVNAACFVNATFGSTVIAYTDFSTAKGIDSIRHVTPSSLGIDSLRLSTVRLPKEFLRGCGVPHKLLALYESERPALSDYYSCFISYAESDAALSKKLYEDLQEAGVRCWRWREDAKWGVILLSSIDKAIQEQDKLILICSKSSLTSPEVLKELERALQKEERKRRSGVLVEVLLPIRVDDFVFQEWEHYRKADVVAKHIGDFCQWQDSVHYRKALERLLRDLKIEREVFAS